MTSTSRTYRKRAIHAAVTYPTRFASIVLLVYLAVLALPSVFSSKTFSRGSGLNDASDVIKHLPFESLLIASILLLITYFKLWPKVGANACAEGTRRYVWCALLFPGIVLAIALSSFFTAESQATILASFPMTSFALLAVMTCFIGLFEELLFRGIVQNGLTPSTGAIKAVIFTALLFGLAHYANWVNGKPFLETSLQVFSAFTSGLLLGALRLVTNSIWPSVIIHACWDFSILLLGKVNAILPSAQDDSTIVTAITLILLISAKPLFGFYLLFAYWEANRR